MIFEGLSPWLLLSSSQIFRTVALVRSGSYVFRMVNPSTSVEYHFTGSSVTE